MEVVDCGSHTDGTVVDMVSECCHASFESGPETTATALATALLRVCVFHNLPSGLRQRLPDNLTNILVLAAPDIAVDKWSLSILLDDLTVLYSSASRSSSAFRSATADSRVAPAASSTASGLLCPVEMDYAMFSQFRMSNILKGPVGDQIWAYWQRVLSGPRPVLHLPTDRLRPRRRTFRTSSVHFAIGQKQCHELLKLAADEGTNLRVLICAIFHTLLFRYTSQNDILLGTTVSCRDESEIRQTVGNFENAVPLRGDFSGNPTLRMLLRRQASLLQGAEAHADQYDQD